jgi:NitT/TauT family transport system ATP-binding protein
MFQKCKENYVNAELPNVALRPEPTHGMPILEVINLSKHFDMDGGRRTVLKNISFNAEAGKMICVTGRSGCGKTTLLNILAGFLMPSSGTVKMNDEPIRMPGPDRCVIFQEDTLFPWLTVRENIAFGLHRRMRDRHRIKVEVDRFLSLVGLYDFQHYLPREVSGGMKQRVAIARVLILQPQVLLMDEPFASLDYHTRKEMQDLLLTIWGELGQTIIFVTHDVDEAITLADTIIAIDKASGSIHEVFPVPLPRPRKTELPEYIFLRKRLYESL